MEWKQIQGFDNYEISTDGQIRNKKIGKTLKQRKDSNGYLLVNLCRNSKVQTFRVHRLVAQTFIPNPQNKQTVNHKDHNRQNNHVENLEWATHEEQCNKTWKKDRSKKVMIIDEKSCKVTICQSVKQCAEYLEVKQPTISKAIKTGGKCKGYKIKLIT